MHSKGQGTIEYLVILAVIVVVSLIVVSLMINSTAPAQGISGTTSTIATASTLLSVTESIVSEDGNYFLKIKNNTGENITITKIEIGDIIDATPNKPIPMNVEEAFILATDSLCSQGQLLAEEVTITYTNQYDLVKKQTFPVPINFECEEFTATVSYTDKDGVTHNEGGGTSGGPTQTCGNNTIEGTEICDGTELGLTTTCQDYDIIYDGGTLYCNNTCDDYNVELCTLAPQTKYTYFSGNDFSYGTFENTKLGSVLADGNAGQITNGLVGLWHLDDSENDSSASGFDGIWNGSEEYTPGLFNTNGGTFDGSTDYIQIDDVTNYYPMTISLWFKSNDIITMGLVGNYQGASYNGWHIYQHTTLGYGLYYYTTGSSTTNRTGTPLAGEVEVGKWKHLVATVDSSGAKIYINGVLDEQGVWTGTPGIPSTTNKMRIGAYGGTMLTNKFNGDIDEVAIWNRSLSEPEVRQIYGAYMDANYYSEVIDTGDTGNPTEYNSIKFNTEEVSYGSEINPTTEKSLADGLVGLWHLNESSGATTFADSSGNGNNGTCSNCPSQATGLWETNAFDFSGTSEEIILGTNPNILPTNAISYSVWVKPDNISTNKGIMVSDTDYDGGFNLFIITTGGGTYRVYSNIGGLKIVAGNKAQIGNWTHLVATFNGSEIRLYENGLLTGSISASGSITGSTELRLSGDTTGAVSNFDGMIEEPSV